MRASIQACVRVCKRAYLSSLCSLGCVSVRVRKCLCVFLFANSGTVSVIALCFGRMRIIVCVCVCVCVRACVRMCFYCVSEIVLKCCSATFSMSV